MADEFAREVIEQARIAERGEERLRDLDLERYQARSLRRGWGTREERKKRMLPGPRVGYRSWRDDRGNNA